MSLQFVINAIDHATGPFRKVDQAITQSTKKFSGLEHQIDKTGSSVTRLETKTRSLASQIGVGLSIAGIMAFGSSVVDTTVKYQKMEAVLSTQLGSMNAGKESMGMIQKFASETPFQVDELTAAYVKLVSQGFKPAKEEMNDLGDLAASMGKPFDQLAEAVLDAQTGEFERLKEFGIKAKQSGDKVAMTFKGQTTVIDKSSASMQKYLLSLGNVNGVMGSMAAISDTTGGKLSNLGDTVDAFKKGLGESLKPVIDGVVDGLRSFMDKLAPVGKWMKEHPAFVKWLALTIGIAAIGITVATVAVWAFNAALWANPITWVVVAIIALAGAIAWVILKFDGWGASISALWSIMKSFIAMGTIGFKIFWSTITYSMEIAWLKIKSFFQWIGEKISNVFEAIQKVKNFDFSGAYESITKKIDTAASKEIEARQKQHLTTLKEYGKSAAGEVKNIGEQWKNVGLTESKESPLEKISNKLTSGSTTASGAVAGGKAGSNAGQKKGEKMASNISNGGARPQTIYVTVQKMIGVNELRTVNVKDGLKEAGNLAVEEILMALQSISGKISTQ